jgi:hypothetical protein
VSAVVLNMLACFIEKTASSFLYVLVAKLSCVCGTFSSG